VVIPVARKLWQEIFVAMPAAIRPAPDHLVGLGLRHRLPAGELPMPHSREEGSGGFTHEP
jgi:hypothetical protein